MLGYVHVPVYTFIHMGRGVVHTYICAYIHRDTYIHTYIHAMHTYMHTYLHTYIHIQACMHRMQIHIHMLIYI